MSLEEVPFNWTGCAGCVVDAPPPDSILLIPPPPLPSFLQVSPLLAEPSNLSDALFLNPEEEEADHIVPPCNPHCDWSNSPGVEYIELSRKGTVALDDTWFLIMVGSSVAVLLLGALLAFILLKCRQEQSRKSQTDAGGCRANKLRPGKTPLPQTQARCCNSSSPHVLWAAITHKGPAHFAVPPQAKLPHADFCRPAASTGYYGALDPRFPTPDALKSEPGTPDSQIYAEIPDIKHPEKLSSFDNTAFEDYLYEDLPAESFPLSEVSRGSLQRHYVGRLRPLVSPPTNIASPNLPPLNLRSRNPLLV